VALSVGSISVMEENAVVKYLDTMLLYFRTIIHSSYSVLVKAEMGSTWERLRFSSRILPSHLSRILLELEDIQAELMNKLSELTVAATIGQQKLNGGSKLFADADVRSWVTDSTDYQVSASFLSLGSWSHSAKEFLFHIICISVLDVYATLVESLTLNAFSLHSTGETSWHLSYPLTLLPSRRAEADLSSAQLHEQTALNGRDGLSLHESCSSDPLSLLLQIPPLLLPGFGGV
jgi:hypothetical protein